jgi:hypothetical protein
MDLDLDGLAKFIVSVLGAVGALLAARRTGTKGSSGRMEETLGGVATEVAQLSADIAEISAAQRRTDAKVSVVLAWQGRHETEHVRR